MPVAENDSRSAVGDRDLGQRAADLLVLAGIVVYLGSYFDPSLLLSPTTTTGGDTASHYFAARYLKDYLLPHGKLVGWAPGNFAGFPMFQLYFPLPFVAMVALSPLVGLQVGFKLVTAAGAFLLPIAAYISFRAMRLDDPAPSVAAVFTLPFLFMENQSMWGGNIPSLLAGEFTYSLGLALLVVYLGTLLRGLERRRHRVGNGVLLAAIGLSHAYTLLAAVLMSSYFLVAFPRTRDNLRYLLAVNGLAFCLLGFWMLPLLGYAEFTTAYPILWPIDGIGAVFPRIVQPVAGVGLLFSIGYLSRAAFRRARHGARPRLSDAAAPDRPAARGRSHPGEAESDHRATGGAGGSGEVGFDHRVGLLSYGLACAAFLYLISHRLEVVDARFVPIFQLLTALLGAVAVGALCRKLRGRWLVGPILACAAVLWTDAHVAYIPQWIDWNYEGFERKQAWPEFAALNGKLRRTAADPRVVYEHTLAHDDVGTVRAFESLPLFSGASTLEGLYMQSSISSPFVFYLQSEISEAGSCPLARYHCGRLDPERAAEHLRLFNVDTLVARSARIGEALRESADFAFEESVGRYGVFRVEGNANRYVEPLRYEPLLLASADWKADFFRWFKRQGSGEVPLVVSFDRRAEPPFERVASLPAEIPRRRLNDGVAVSERVAPEEIVIRTSRIGHPLLVKVSYHPRWRVEGADAVYLASPSFMLVVPTDNEVRLFFGAPLLVRAGHLLTLTGVLVVVASILGLGSRTGSRRRATVQRASRAATSTSADRRSHPPPSSAGASRDPSARPSNAVRQVRSLVSRAGQRAGHGLDRLDARRPWIAPAAVVFLLASGVAIRTTHTDPWAVHDAARERFESEEYDRAAALFEKAAALLPSSSAALYSEYYRALCAFRQQRWEETLERFSELIRSYPHSELLPEAHFRVAESLQGLGRPDEARTRFELVIDRFADTEWAGYAQDRLRSSTPPATLPSS